jgi:NADPH:quinone reductase-like Zn-dependent oxidoreductase
MGTDGKRTYTTSYEGLVGRGKAKAGDWVLVHAGAGGVGLAACQIAKAIGCKVIATASSEEKRRVCKDKAGVDEVVDYTKDGWQVSSFYPTHDSQLQSCELLRPRVDPYRER